MLPRWYYIDLAAKRYSIAPWDVESHPEWIDRALMADYAEKSAAKNGLPR